MYFQNLPMDEYDTWFFYVQNIISVTILLIKSKSVHTMNQSMVQQLTNDGYNRNQLRNDVPIGLKHNMMCNFCLQRLIKNEKTASALMSRFLLPP